MKSLLIILALATLAVLGILWHRKNKTKTSYKGGGGASIDSAGNGKAPSENQE